MRGMLGIILGGGRGTRLYPLTRDRAKPAVPFLGQYRLIDIPISHCLNSGIRRIYLLTQFNTESLHRHIADTYKFDAFGESWVHILAAQQTLTSTDWYQGTADAVRQNLGYVLDQHLDHVLVLSGDHLYRMNFNDLLEGHVAAGTPVTVCCTPATEREASSLGVVRTRRAGDIVDFAEKPADPASLEEGFRLSAHDSAARGLPPERGPYLASMGIYLFTAAALVEALESSPEQSDFGREIIPGCIRNMRVRAHYYTGYWKDIGTIGSFYEANLTMARPEPAFDLHVPEWPIYTRPRFLPPPRVEDCRIEGSLIGGGGEVTGREVSGSVIGVRSIIGPGTVIRRCVVMGADYFERTPPGDRVALGIGRDCVIEKAIIDKNARIGDGVRILDRPRPTDADADLYCIRDGIVVVPKNTVIPPGTEI
ncbi:MAG: sugar phosphate nucleotidyltransferase [Candidatus Brocadiia bacterium]|nr:sugar phosphate nucleotidyltransferase [Candidatus Brocadiia bacterium]